MISRIAMWKRFARDAKGTAAVEFAVGGMVLVIGVLNAVDLGYYSYQRMEVENAAQVGAQAAWKTCNDVSTMLPATLKCTGLTTAITAAVQSTSLGSAVSLSSGYPIEGYYCAASSGGLQRVGDVSASAPSSCSAAGNANVSPGDYIQVAVSYTYSPLFPGFSVMGLWGVSSISMTSWMRLG
jgi:Flp pilus assembly protein TadG